ncbi:MAG: DUF5060 domain-containing protein [Candidatus Didemnitutus sp.]|nr:DUF5060 domain-containing protein [Candidatus Didemnitutus sp.]
MRRPTTFVCLVAALLALLPAAVARAGPVRFEFTVAPAPGIANPFAREIWAEVTPPSGATLLLPAFYVGQQIYAVHARPDRRGTYTLGRILESTRGAPATAIAATPHSPSTFENPAPLRLPPVGVDPRSPGGFARADGHAFMPFGANVAWAPEPDVLAFYRATLDAFAANHLNWMRVWMVHWGGTNLDWPRPEDGVPIPPGGIDATVAARWDSLLAAAEERGVYLQIVLQHHGQYSTAVNPSWIDNPWNAAHPGGFLKTPAEFFTDPRARLLTALKYRYIVARWGWSPAVFAWELFNEVHWVDALKLDRDETAVAQWHADMVRLIRSVDVYAHPITTSTEDLRSPIYAAMDFLQPHLYSADLVAAARTFAPRRAGDTRPVFYGEFGDDHLRLPDDVKKSGLVEPPAVWASLMGVGSLPAQAWEGEKLRATRRLAELGAVHRFVVLSGWSRHHDLQPFSAAVECTARVPLQLDGAQPWQRRPAREFTLPLDGREPLELGDWPATFATPAAEAKDGFPSRAVFHATFPRATVARLEIVGVSENGGALRVSLDGQSAAAGSWPAGDTFPATLTFPIPAGSHAIALENTGARDWVQISHLDLGLTAPALAAIGQRNDRFIALWVRHRANLFALEPGAPSEGTIVLDDVPAGTWEVKWWDTAGATVTATEILSHAGGTLRLPTHAVTRHAAIVLSRQP